MSSYQKHLSLSKLHTKKDYFQHFLSYNESLRFIIKENIYAHSNEWSSTSLRPWLKVGAD